MRDSLDPALSQRLRAIDARLLLRCVLVSCAAAALFWTYGGTLHFPFVFDDLDAIVHNPTLRAPSLWAAWLPPDDTPVSGRPLPNLSFALNYRAAGAVLEPYGFRALNLALHALNGVLAYALLRCVLSRPVVPPRLREQAAGCAFCVALGWLLHPLQTESVVYVTQRTELLAGLFVLCAVLCALRYLHDPRADSARSWLLLAAVSCGLGSGCKESVIVIPLLVLALDVSFYSESFARALRQHRALYLALCLGLLPLLLQSITLPRDRTAGFALGVTAWQALALSGQAIAWYLRLCFWPAPLSVTYNWSYALGFAHYWPADLLVAALGLFTLWLFWKRRWAAAAGAWFFALLAPTTSIVPILSEAVAERRMYLPLLAVLSVAVAGLYVALPRARSVAAVGCVLLAAAGALRSHSRGRDFASAEALFTAALHAAPDNPQAMWGLASALEERGQDARALELYDRMAERPYPYAGPASWGTRGLVAASHVYARGGDPERARATLKRALDHDPNSAIGRLQRAAALVAGGDEQRAIALLEQLLTQPYLHDRVHRELAALYQRRGDLARASSHLRAAER